MKVLFVTHVNRSHLYFQAPLAWALRAAGHEVRVAGQPEVVEEITRIGLTAVSVGEETHGLENMPQQEQAPPEGHRSEQRQTMPVQSDYAKDDPDAELADLTWNGYTLFSPESMIDDLVAYARQWRPDLVIWDEITFAGAVAARACGAAHARVLIGTDSITQLRTAIRERAARPGERPATDALRDWLGPILERYGCEFGEDVVLGQWTIDPLPDWHWRPAGADFLAMRQIPFNGGGIIPRWLYEPPARKRVCITLGITHRDYLSSEASADNLLDAVAGLDIDVVATLTAEQLKPLSRIPDNVRTVEFIPMTMLLPTCSAVIHHGGGGTFATAVENGVPQLIVPSTYWCLPWWGPIAQANGLTEQGAGLFVADSDHLTPAMLREDLIRVLEEPSFQQNAARLREESARRPSPSELVPILEELTLAHRGA
jgi:glycosyltransferase (activator-dependent family)